MSQPDFSSITESPGLQATQKQLERLYHRYHFAKQFCIGKDVLEIACGSGIGLGYLSAFSNSVTGGDIDNSNIMSAKKLCQNNSKIKIKKTDAHHLQYADNSFDVVLLYEAIYYLEHPERFIDESSRILRSGGTLIICTVNKDWKDFHPSPFTHQYFSVPELYNMTNKKYSEVKVFGSFKTETGIAATIFSFIKRLALRLNLIPGSLRLRAYLKRIFIGKTFPLPPVLHEGMTSYQAPEELDNNQKSTTDKILYVIGKKL